MIDLISISSLRLDSTGDLPGYLVTSDLYWLKNHDRLEDGRNVPITSKGWISEYFPSLIDSKQGRKLVSINPHTKTTYRSISISNGLKKKQLMLLAALSFKFDEVIGWSVRNKLYDKVMKYDEIAKAEMLFALSSYSHALVALTWYFRSYQSFKGFVVQNQQRVCSAISLIPTRIVKLRKSQRVRGYRDKGSLPAFDQWIEKDFASPVQRRIEDIDSQIRTLLQISTERGYFVPQKLLEELLADRRELISKIKPIGDYSFSMEEDD